MHEYIDNNPAKAMIQIRQAFETQENWQDLALEAVAEYAEKTLSFIQQANQNLQGEIRNEAAQANIQFVPTIVLGDHIFDESIDEATLKAYIAE
ncbi:bifunctional disulfide isomerase/thiol-disulfide oxidase [Enterococcus faecium]|nr:bifunctional disulfide isomerase/thiol-disulfide oxidase [Enterococcus faecium]